MKNQHITTKRLMFFFVLVYFSVYFRGFAIYLLLPFPYLFFFWMPTDEECKARLRCVNVVCVTRAVITVFVVFLLFLLFIRPFLGHCRMQTYFSFFFSPGQSSFLYSQFSPHMIVKKKQTGVTFDKKCSLSVFSIIIRFFFHPF